MEDIIAFIDANLVLNFIKNNIVLITFGLSIFNFFIRIYDKRFKLKYELYNHALIKSVDAQVATTTGVDKQYVSVMPVISLVIQNCSNLPITISFLILEDSKGNRVKSKLEPSYLTTTMGNYFDLNGDVKLLENHIYTENYPIKIDSNSSGLYRFRFSFKSTFIPVKAFIQTSKKTSRLKIIEEPLKLHLLSLEDKINKMNDSLSF